jgi:hypothetical protein
MKGKTLHDQMNGICKLVIIYEINNGSPLIKEPKEDYDERFLNYAISRKKENRAVYEGKIPRDLSRSCHNLSWAVYRTCWEKLYLRQNWKNNLLGLNRK